MTSGVRHRSARGRVPAGIRDSYTACLRQEMECRLLQGGRYQRIDSVVMYDFGSNRNGSHALPLHEPGPRTVSGLATRLAAFYGDHGEWVYMDVYESLGPDSGFTFRGPFEIMYRPATPPEAAIPASVSIRDVTSASDCSLWGGVNVRAYPHPRLAGTAADTLIGPPVLSTGVCRLWLACWDDEPAGTGAAIVLPDVTYLFGISTLETHRRRGMGAAMVTHILSATGTPALLVAEPGAVGLYRRLGFVPTGHRVRAAKLPAIDPAAATGGGIQSSH